MGYKFTDGDVRFLANELGQGLEEMELEVRDFEHEQSKVKNWNKYIFGG